MFERENYPIFNKGNLVKIATSHSLRCDSKQFEQRFDELNSFLEEEDFFYLGELLPNPIIKGSQPKYIEGSEGIPVINTLTIQKMEINIENCRYISEEDFYNLSDNRKVKENDVLLTMDGGTSIGKPVLFELNGDYTVDSHVAILRPHGISPKALVYLLASPAGQLQFQKAESGASGQTSVTEEDLRRFRFPSKMLDKIDDIVNALDKKRLQITRIKNRLNKRENKIWEEFTINALKGDY
ncbi:restriction endonuclease subunit S [Jeotgalibacillus salarius]|uniref:restriction endonuclease subunit S n=1 Tax=Jeotgalibacillus salarius TaxID=546023 RepID=UPI00141B3C98|nr:restriction endonuclease subunit S [Jeotgalibacillus salarius]